ncbi:MAG: HAMP domain-containing histidine kinase [Actinobacteria bacterium]|nr:HAMP domain-containing histidine kinase [Actinomycetota bacterium]
MTDLSLLATAAVDLLRPAATQPGVALRVGGDEVLVRANPHRIAQVFENLIGNAIKYSPGATVSRAFRVPFAPTEAHERGHSVL